MEIAGNRILMTEKEFHRHVVAMSFVTNPGGEDGQGVLALVVSREQCFIGRFGFDGSVGPFDTLVEKNEDIYKSGPHWLVFDWRGTWDQMMDMAFQLRDPVLPNRIIDEKDCDYQSIRSLYWKLVNMVAVGRKCKNPFA